MLLIKIETLFNLRSSSSLWNSFFAPIAFSSFSLSRGDTEELIGLTPQLKAQGRAGLFFLFLLSKTKKNEKVRKISITYAMILELKKALTSDLVSLMSLTSLMSVMTEMDT